MKKLLIVVLVVAMLITGSIAVLAAEGERTSNMDAETYLELRLAQIEKALDEGRLTEEEAIILQEHVEDRASDGAFGRGPSNENRGEGNEECIMGEGAEQGIFRNENSGQRLGNGYGKGIQKRDGTGDGNGGKGYRNGNGNNGQGNGRGNGAGNS